MGKGLQHSEDSGWIGTKNRRQTRALASALHKRTARTVLVSKKEGSQGTTEALRIARSAAGDQGIGIATVDTSDCGILGAKLSKLTQALAYRGIGELQKKVSRKATNTSIEKIQEALRADFAHTPTAATIWKSIRHRDISRPIRTFLWKSIHNAHRIGKFCENIPECQDRAICSHCKETESLEHIILGCSKPATFTDEKNRPVPSTGRLYRILITESAFLIWKLRCESVIQHNGAPPTERGVQNRWIWTINERLNIDRSQYSLPYSLVLETWKGTLNDEAELPENWISKSEVLVGIIPIGPLQPPASPPAGVG
ncbi:hypothetical protein C8R43DRAFT_1092558 [Mycena crocata]|nr:hypothetical protein C8R43DRAFT_1092558 [Mycena crocata]